MQPVNKTRNDLWMTLDNSWASRFYKRNPISLVLNYKVFLNRLQQQQQQPNEISSFALFHNKKCQKKIYHGNTLGWLAIYGCGTKDRWLVLHDSFILFSSVPSIAAFPLGPHCMSNAPFPSTHYSILLISFTAF